MTARGHEDQFPLCRLNARCVIRKETLAGTYGNGRDAPRPAVRRAKTVRRDRPRTQWRSHEYGAAVDNHYLTGRVALAHQIEIGLSDLGRFPHMPDG
jgi:hypothetical protein